MVVGIDWDDTISIYSNGLSKLVEYATEVHIITLNKDITEKLAKSTLEYDNHLHVHIMPDEAFTNGGNYGKRILLNGKQTYVKNTWLI